MCLEVAAIRPALPVAPINALYEVRLQLSHTRGGGYESPHHPFSFFFLPAVLVLHWFCICSPSRNELSASLGADQNGRPPVRGARLRGCAWR